MNQAIFLVISVLLQLANGNQEFVPDPKLPISPPADEYVKEINSWTFKKEIALIHGTPNPLESIVCEIFNRFEWIQVIKLDKDRVHKFLIEIEKNYEYTGGPFKSNIFYNSQHAVEVVQTVYWFLENTDLKYHLDTKQHLALVLAALLIHYKHPGTHNKFEEATNSELWKKYGNSSFTQVIERNTFEEARKLFANKDSPTDLLSGLESKDRSYIESNLELLLLNATLEHHDEMINKLNDFFDNAEPNQYPDPSLVMIWVFYCAQFGAPTKAWAIYKMWGENIYREFRRLQVYEKEKRVLGYNELIQITLPMTKKQAREQIVYLDALPIQIFLYMDAIVDRFKAYKVPDDYLSPWMKNMKLNQLIWDRIIADWPINPNDLLYDRYE